MGVGGERKTQTQQMCGKRGEGVGDCSSGREGSDERLHAAEKGSGTVVLRDEQKEVAASASVSR